MEKENLAAEAQEELTEDPGGCHGVVPSLNCRVQEAVENLWTTCGKLPHVQAEPHSMALSQTLSIKAVQELGPQCMKGEAEESGGPIVALQHHVQVLENKIMGVLQSTDVESALGPRDQSLEQELMEGPQSPTVKPDVSLGVQSLELELMKDPQSPSVKPDVFLGVQSLEQELIEGPRSPSVKPDVSLGVQSLEQELMEDPRSVSVESEMCHESQILEEEAAEDFGPAATEPALYRRVQALEKELQSCQEELKRIQRQLSHSQRLHQTAESSNQELQRQVEELRQEIHDRGRSEKVDKEVQADDYAAWSDYYNYYYSSYANHSDTDPYPAEASQESQPAELISQPLTDSESCRSDRDHCVGEEQETHYGQTVAQNEEGTSLAESLRATAEAALSQTGVTYDETSGMYYDHSTGFYYNSESQLYYDPATGIYYYCDVESGRYQFHSKVDLQTYKDPQPSKQKRGKKKRRESVAAQEEGGASEEMRASSFCSAAHDTVSPYEREESSSGSKKLKLSSLEASTRDSSSSVDDSEPEEGELTDSEKTSSDEEMSSADSASAHNSEPEDAEQIWPPCIRVIVVRSPVLQKGSLFIITAVKSATIGREKDMAHTIRIPEVGVSKFHAEVYFDHMLQSYVLVDQGSQNGTVINGNHILQPKTVCEPYVLNHGDEVKFGETVLSFHVHPGSETCDGCEPGQVRAHLRLNQKEEGSAGPVLNKEEKEMLRRKGLKKIREKYGLQSAEYEDNKVLKNPKYKDRANRRRQVVGSEGTFKREDAPASVHIEINESNKGRKMLEKMGWKKGEGLGKTSDGMRDPIHLQLHKKQAGLGTRSATSIEDLHSQSQNKKNWEKARERYAETFQEAKKPETKKATSWVKSAQ